MLSFTSSLSSFFLQSVYESPHILYKMKSFLALPYLLPLVLAAESQLKAHRPPPALDPLVPIHLGELFWPPSKTIIAWLPTAMQSPLDFCSKATETPPERLFSLAGVDGLAVHGYFSSHAYITREGKRYAECYVTPESVKMGICQGAKHGDYEGGHVFQGLGSRKWTCWIRHPLGRKLNGPSERAAGDDFLTDDAVYPPTAMVLGTAAGGVVMGAFTPRVTGG